MATNLRDTIAQAICDRHNDLVDSDNPIYRYKLVHFEKDADAAVAAITPFLQAAKRLQIWCGQFAPHHAVFDFPALYEDIKTIRDATEDVTLPVG